MTIQEFIHFVVEKFASSFDPEKIYLFGSQAREDSNYDSDIDFLVIESSNQPKRMRSLKFRKALRGNNLYPVDILVYTPDEFEKEQHIKGTIAYNVAKEGQVLYE